MKEESRIPSEMFREAFSSQTSGCRRQCHCDKVWFDSEQLGYDWNEGELEKLIKQSKAEPHRCVAVTYSIPTYIFQGKEIVWDCDCDHANAAKIFEETILKDSRRVARFLNYLSDSLIEKANNLKVKEQP